MDAVDGQLEHEDTEHSPLLGRVASPVGHQHYQTPKLLTRHTAILAGAFSSRILYSFGAAFVELPLVQLQEGILCDHFNAASTSHWPCKQEDVQKELSILRQWLVMAQLLPTLLVGVPMGIVADRYGRTVVLGLALFGAALALGASVLICMYSTYRSTRASLPRLETD